MTAVMNIKSALAIICSSRQSKCIPNFKRESNDKKTTVQQRPFFSGRAIVAFGIYLDDAMMITSTCELDIFSYLSRLICIIALPTGPYIDDKAPVSKLRI
eukprot:TRINITY_DN5430_c0_g1_i4.p1 TRINITY_DN5430_c0_g1~~TRINITY_DN5430_c0_g1_i4.p1  ORF type:complete len:100 (-),score=21.79 TRINITY_DN5430_c0_g1_i4:387-686(-)